MVGGVWICTIVVYVKTEKLILENEHKDIIDNRDGGVDNEFCGR